MNVWDFPPYFAYLAFFFTCFASEKCSSTWSHSKLRTLASARSLERGLDDIVSEMKFFQKDFQRYLRLTEKSHKLKSLSKTKFTRIADMSDMEGFKRDRLKPLLKVRVSGTEANKEVQEFLKGYMDDLGWTIEEDEFPDMTPDGERTFNNIIATQDPEALRQLVIACHFDSKEFKDFNFIAATDSAVPCAMMLDAAYLLNSTIWSEKHRQTQDVSLQFIFFDGEEAFKSWTATDSLYGSRHLAEKWSREEHKYDPESNRLKGIDVFMLLDLLGTENPTFYSWFESSQHLYDRLIKIEKKLHDAGKLEGHTAPYFLATKGYDFSSGIEDDHRPFESQGVCIIHMIPTPFPDVWHKEGDNEKCLSYTTIDNLNKILRVFIAEYMWM